MSIKFINYDLRLQKTHIITMYFSISIDDHDHYNDMYNHLSFCVKTTSLTAANIFKI